MSLVNAASDIRLLLDRGYPQKSAVRFVCAHYRLEEKKPENIVFLLDSQISNSGMLARKLREMLEEAGLKGDARTSNHVDHDLKICGDIVASSDGVIIDEAKNAVNFLACVVERFRDMEVHPVL